MPPEENKMTLNDLRSMMKDTMSPVVRDIIDEKIGTLLEQTTERSEEQQQEMRDVMTLLRESYNRDSRNKPFKDANALSRGATQYVEDVWKPLMREGGHVSKEAAEKWQERIVQKTTSPSLEGTDTLGG